MNIELIKEIIESNNIKVLYLNYIDFKGQVRTKVIYTHELLKNIKVFFQDGISITGSLIDEHDEKSIFFIIKPIPETFTIINWVSNSNEKMAYILCDILNSSLDSRLIVKHITERLKSHHLKPMCGLGITYKLSNLNELEKASGYYRCFPGSDKDFFNNRLVTSLLESGIEVEYYIPSGPEYAHLALEPKELLKAIDNYTLGKWISTSYAMNRNKNIQFLKPFENSAPIHLSIWDEYEKNNLFYDSKMDFELSVKGYSFIAGILYHFDELFAIIIASNGHAPKENYKKNYSFEDDDSVISAPCYFHENGKMIRAGWSKRCIFRGIDCNVNLYLVIACIFAAGFDGIQKNYKLDNLIDKNYGIASSTTAEKMHKLENNNLFNEFLGTSIIKLLKEKLLIIINKGENNAK